MINLCLKKKINLKQIENFLGILKKLFRISRKLFTKNNFCQELKIYLEKNGKFFRYKKKFLWQK